MRATRVDSHSRGLSSNVGARPHSGSGWQLIRQHVRLAHSDARNGRRSVATCGVAFSGASHRPHSSGAALPRGQPGGPLSPESPRPLRATEVPGPVVLQPRRLPTPSRSGDLWTFLGAPPRSSTRMTSGRFGFPVGCRGHGHPRVRRVVRTPPPGCEHTGEQILLMRQFHFTSLPLHSSQLSTIQTALRRRCGGTCGCCVGASVSKAPVRVAGERPPVIALPTSVPSHWLRPRRCAATTAAATSASVAALRG